MPRPEISLGGLGNVSCTLQRSGRYKGKYRARGTFRHPYTGRDYPLDFVSESDGKARKKLQDDYRERLQIADKSLGVVSKSITRKSKFSSLIDAFIEEKALEVQEGTLDQTTFEGYLAEINDAEPRRRKDGTPDLRYSRNAIKIRPMLGDLRNWEVDANRLDGHLKSIRANGNQRKAQLHHLILTGIVRLGVKLGAMPVDPMSVVRKGGKRRRNKAPAMDEETRNGLQAQLKKWLAGEEIPGTPAYAHGPKRDPDILRIADILLASGCRPYEGLAFRRCDLLMKTDDGEGTDKWRLVVCGTIKRKKGENGLYRQNWTKTDAGYRIVVLPQWAVNTLKEMGAEKWRDDDESPLFPSRSGGWRDPHNTARTWRAARGTEYAWITARTMRRTNLTTVAEDYGTEQASRQGGHAVISTGADITNIYLDRPRQAPDSTPALERLR
ncbi:hypothetical protein OG203_34665 [Nocardia sp. NBC_01499]|uniref:hypothetical protein n=1 Tax=Nocardia sp. NBC_01499 TaxID=2903597 RepID=UPI003869C39B